MSKEEMEKRIADIVKEADKATLLKILEVLNAPENE